jgi:TolA-binding protein
VPEPHEPAPSNDPAPSRLADAPLLPVASPPQSPSLALRAARREPAPAKSKATASVAASPRHASEPGTRAADPELAAFRRAHDLHFAGAEPRAAIQAFADYLAAYPEGRFVPEARYNTALDWLKLGDKARAQQLLEPFARGNYDGYRRDEAARLLEALH